HDDSLEGQGGSREPNPSLKGSILCRRSGAPESRKLWQRASGPRTRANLTKMFHVNHFGKVRAKNLTTPKTAALLSFVRSIDCSVRFESGSGGDSTGQFVAERRPDVRCDDRSAVCQANSKPRVHPSHAASFDNSRKGG